MMFLPALYRPRITESGLDLTKCDLLSHTVRCLGIWEYFGSVWSQCLSVEQSLEPTVQMCVFFFGLFLTLTFTRKCRKLFGFFSYSFERWVVRLAAIDIDS